VNETLRQRLVDAGQGELFEGIAALDESTRERFESQLGLIDWELLARLIESVQSDRSCGVWDESEMDVDLPFVVRQPEAESAAAGVRGEQLLAEGRVGVVTVAGGRGSRLGSEAPKGLLSVMPVSGGTLFEHFAAAIHERTRRAGRPIPWLVMTSPATDAATREYFGDQQFFGLDPDHVVLFEQGTMPAVDVATGGVLLSEPGRVASSPDGHGGLVEAMQRAELFGWLSDRGIDTLFYHQVDNPAVLPPDPRLLGWHDLKASQMTTRVVSRRSADERVGVVVAVEGRTRIVEYIDLSESAAAATDQAGRLKLWAGNIAVHVLDCSFLERAADSNRLPWHRVRRSVGQAAGETAWQFERFVFDLLVEAEVGLVVEGVRSRDFLPVKQASGDDSLESARAGLIRLHRGWLEAAGGRVGESAVIEISPGWALSAEDVARRVGSDDVFEGSMILS
jgi:UDP-N-acetylglucosamine/UDP-N-acetylgalactosamine diphosphorylase